MVLRKSFYIRWSAGRSPRVHEVNPGRDPSKYMDMDLTLSLSLSRYIYFPSFLLDIPSCSPCIYFFPNIIMHINLVSLIFHLSHSTLILYFHKMI